MSREDELAAIDAAIASGQIRRISAAETEAALSQPILIGRFSTIGRPFSAAKRAGQRASLARRDAKMREAF